MTHYPWPPHLRVHTDELTRRLYSTDASMYEELPQAVCFPKSARDIQELVSFCAQYGISITPRTAGTSLAGQATGGGLIMDVSRYMTTIESIDPKTKVAHVQPGVVRDTLNNAAKAHHLLFGPDTSTTNRCMIGGMIGNNSSGSFSIKYGTTRDNIHSIEAVLSDGSRVDFRPLSLKELEDKKKLPTLEGHIYREMLTLLEEHKELIETSYPHPEIKRRNTGYALDKLLEMEPFTKKGRSFNLAEFLCGSEGTLALTTSAKVQLTDTDPYSILIIPHFTTLRESLVATVEAVKFEPAAVELTDRIILDATKGNIEQRSNRFFIEGDPETILMIQLDGNDKSELRKRAEALVNHLKQQGLGYAHPVIDKVDQMVQVWNLRKAGLGLLMGLGTEQKTPTFVEDTAVRVADLPEYIDEFSKILKKHQVHCVFYAHASVGELHLRPSVNIKTEAGIAKMKAIAEEVATLVKKFRGSLSGEHGDGRARAPYIPLVLGEKMMPILEKVKHIWDSHHLFNPGKIVHAKPIDEQLRHSPNTPEIKVETVFQWRTTGGFGEAVEQCNGAGVCRKLVQSGGTMCPSYMATREEKDSTRGRANMFRQLFSGKQSDAFSSDELQEALDLCLSCKACKTECPANVDMAKMKAEYMHGRHQQKGTPLAHHFFGNPVLLYPLAQLTPQIVNFMAGTNVGKELFRQFLGISPRRTLPQFESQPFEKWHHQHAQNGRVRSSEKVLLIVDLFTNHHDLKVGKAAVQVLEALGFEVLVTPPTELGRTQLSKGLLDSVSELCGKNIRQLSHFAEQRIPIIGLEPSEILTIRDEYLDLCNEDQLESAQLVAGHTFFFDEFIAKIAREMPDRFSSFKRSEQKVVIHGHCHQKALIGTVDTVSSLQAIGLKTETLPTGCCGMAGSFGYEESHYDVSMDIGELVLFPRLRELESDTLICAPGFSCRHQISDGVQKKAQHTAEILATFIGSN